MKKIRVLIVDDSALVRQTLQEILSSDPRIEVMGVAPDPYVAAEKMRVEAPDVITLDVEMPRMDGLTFLKKIMDQHPIPVVICSSLAGKGTETAMRALEFGAVEVIHKPSLGTKQMLQESTMLICDAVVAASRTRARKRLPDYSLATPKLSADAVIPRGRPDAQLQTTEKVVVVGASTGGTEALRVLLEALPENCPGIAIVQHMPEGFTKAFSQRLNSLCRITVREACNNDTILPGHALIAPGNRHLLLKRSGARYYVEIKDGPLVCRHRPSVDVLFRSASRYAGRNAIGVIMTGMGDDGARGMLELKESGAYTIAQDESSCVVFGMPAEAIKMGGVQKVLPLDAIHREIMKAYNSTTTIGQKA
ncbi:MAG: chemotaxis response regulator protein-glutamate methylesterase [Pseudomonadota bacterium]|jgi:two-component system chemotaxis response regulator CheB|uniref:protein-glutamate methylesterase n=1 Tax=anaerobic digester metagenome TaxID=1263854 RepID=A0A485LXT9_9ZZZZ|nr:chemotaxis response regulator protein-glutamate methylesterase [Pseudomonadota bacterium]HRR22342.1 chemotaxis response regulator protein-glutamate methylesterase [Desulfomonilia bacterium]HRR70451.1 chemotaxis response regulator protein-glutamate methylesterase [Desulfomonilia bacterium]HRT46054.1 chemotaxis response regulator protein-glutamate methylesterase [Desulfomonilia bacterium]